MSCPNYAKIIQKYQEKIDELIDNLGRDIQLVFEDTIQVDDAEFDAIHGGVKKPRFKKDTIATTSNSSTIKALVDWNPKNLEKFNINVEKNKNIVSLKCYMTDVPALKRAKYIIVSTESDTIFHTKYQLVKFPFPRGLGQDRYAISFWEAA